MAVNVPGLPIASSLGVYNGPNMSGAGGTAALQAVDPSLINQTTQAILGLEGTATQDTYGAEAQAVAAQGDTAEAGAYGTASQIAGQENVIAGISGQVQQYQQQLSVQSTLGSQQAAEGAAGFTESGTALNLMRSSLQQGRLGSQLIGMQTALTQEGYTEQEAAASAEQQAALAAAAQATVLGTEYSTAASTATLNETNATNDLTAYLKSLNPTGWPGQSSLNSGDQQLLKDLTAGNSAAVALDINTLTTGNPIGNTNHIPTGPTGQINGAFGPYGTNITPATGGLGGFNPFAPPGQTLAVVGPIGAALNNPSGA